MDALKLLAEQSGTTMTAATSTVSRISFSWSYAAIGGCLAVIAAALVYYITVYSKTRPLGGDNFVGGGSKGNKEGFFGGAAEGTGAPFCSASSAEASELYAMFDKSNLGPNDTVTHDDFREFKQLLGKLCCLKKDLLSPSGIVYDTKLLDYATTSDMEPVQETAARCLTKTIPQRDLDLAFDKWNKRGTDLLLHLCTGAGLTEGQVLKAEQLWNALWKDVYDVANTQCIGRPGSFMSGQEPKSDRDPKPFSTLSLIGEGPYKSFSIGLF